MTRTYNVLFLCTGNSARSILAERLMEQHGAGRFRAFSAGSFPKGAVHPLALRLLAEQGLPTEGLRSKSWEEFTAPDAPRMDFVFTVCDQAASEPCPVWPGHPITAHWGVPDPVAVEGGEVQRMFAFREACAALGRRIAIFASLRLEALDGLAIRREVEAIGRDAADVPKERA
jgi:protein-tyrosine-phosphatase